MDYDLISFDMDGVIYSSEKMIGDAYQRAITHYKETNSEEVVVPSLEQIIEQLGNPIVVIFENLFPRLSANKRSEIAVAVLVYLVENVNAKKGELLLGSREILEKLKGEGKKIGLASNGRAPYLNAILDSYDLRKYFDAVIFVGEEYPSKGSLIVGAGDILGISAERTLMVGDRKVDWLAAKEAKVDFAMIYGGHGNDFNGEKSKFEVENLLGLLDK